MHADELGLSELTLERLGYGAHEASYAIEGLVPARVVLEHRDRVELASGQGVLVAELAGRVRARKKSRDSLDKPAVGDFVLVRMGAPPIVEAVIPRRNALVRQAAGAAPRPQIVASNVDVAFVMSSLGPDVNERRIERYAEIIGRAQIPAAMVLSKIDLGDPAEDLARLRDAWPGVPLLAISARSGEGVAELAAMLGPGKTGLLLGSSGVGKSTLVNALLGRELQETREIRPGDLRGRHTTTFRALIPIGARAEGGLLIDSPGMRELEAWDGGEGGGRERR